MLSAQSHTGGVQLQQVVKSYGSVQAVRGIDLSINRGETVALLGPNGAGKSTTIDMILGLAQPDSGSVTLFGQPPSQAVSQGRVGGMLQIGSLIPRLTVRELVTMVASLYPHPLPVEETLRVTSTSAFADRRTTKLSGGQAQRVRFALALVADPDLLVLDEPTAALDVESRREFWKIMRGVAEGGKTVLFATHYLEEADAYADRIILMASGRVVADGSSTAIKAAAGGRTIRATLPGADRTALSRLPGVQAAGIHGDTVVARLPPTRRSPAGVSRPLPPSARHRSQGGGAGGRLPRADRLDRRRSRLHQDQPSPGGRLPMIATHPLSRSVYVRYEVMRTFRNWRFLLFSLGFPLILFLIIAGSNRHARIDGVSFPLYYMTGMAAWGAMMAVISTGGNIANERQLGWTRQIRITPLPRRVYFQTKVLCGYLMAGTHAWPCSTWPGAMVGVSLGAGAWAAMTGLILVGLVPFVVLGILLGHLLTPDSLGPAMGGVTSLLALLGGAWGPLATTGVLLEHRQGAPFVLAGPGGQDGDRWPWMAGRGVGGARGLGARPGLAGRSGRTCGTRPGSDRRSEVPLTAMAEPGCAADGGANDAWVVEQNRWARGWRRVVFPGVFLVYLVAVAERNRPVLARAGRDHRIHRARRVLRGVHRRRQPHTWDRTGEALLGLLRRRRRPVPRASCRSLGPTPSSCASSWSSCWWPASTAGRPHTWLG